MRHEELRDAARKHPFRPFRVHLTTGATFDIRHPDLIMVGQRSAVIGIPSSPDMPVYDRTLQVDLLHVVGIEDLPSASPSSNGPGV